MYLGNCLHGDLGISLNENRPVTRIIGESFTVSFDAVSYTHLEVYKRQGLG